MIDDLGIEEFRNLGIEGADNCLNIINAKKYTIKPFKMWINTLTR